MPILKGKKMSGKPLVSVMVPAHNEEKYLGKCLTSLLNQTYKPIEIIAVDNSSTDKTWEVIQSFKKYGVKGIKLTGFQMGPGKANNAGAKIAKGKIFMLTIADFEFGPNYISNLIKPILNGETVGTMHHAEKIGNLDKIWARAYTKYRVCAVEKGMIFHLIRRDTFFKYGPLDLSLGYADDQTFFRKHNIESLVVDSDVWHYNTENFKETWNHDVWIGKSMKNPWLVIPVVFVFPAYAIYKTIIHLVKKDFYWKFIFFLPVFYSLRIMGYSYGAVKRLLKK
ncbi:MAG: glycosyltransferase family 2 protein [Candidatus Nanoarchaeia archaeon]|nr:glycosyltransferase family 2 protein [Candidatus Nanoarchaeia archaeon]